MGTLRRLKAYFGMIPADEIDDYDAYEVDGYEGDYRRGYRHRPDYLDDEDEYEPYRGRRPPEPASPPERGYREYPQVDRSRRPVVSAASMPPAADTPVHGALAMEPRRDPAPRQRPVTAPQQPSAVQQTSYPIGRIVTLHPSSYHEARAIGEHYRDGNPVIMNLTELDDADARRLVDFAAGLAFALRGSMDKVTNKVFLISPPNQDPTAEDKRRIAEGGLFTRT